MPINTKELLDCVTILLEEENMKVTIKETGKGTLVCATACFVGGLLAGPIGLAIGGSLGGLGAAALTRGLLGGPVGLAVGGTVGGLTAMIVTKDSFKPIGEVIKNDLTEQQREMLAQKVMSAIQQFHPADIAAIAALLANNHTVKDAMIKTAADYLTNEMKLQIID